MSPPELVPEWPPCTYACPARIDIPEYLRRIAQGKPQEAYAVIWVQAFWGVYAPIHAKALADEKRSLTALLQYAPLNATQLIMLGKCRKK